MVDLLGFEILDFEIEKVRNKFINFKKNLSKVMSK